jgi:hypothetical protein
MKMTLLEANRTIETCDNLFHKAAKAWERGNNSGNAETLRRCELQSDGLRQRAESILRDLGIAVNYPGLYPSFTFTGLYPSLTFKGKSFYTTESAVSAAIE